MQIFISIILMCDFACILLSLGMVIYKVIQTDRVMKQLSNIYKNCNHTQMAKVLQRHRNTKAVIFQASSYIAAFLAVGVIRLPPVCSQWAPSTAVVKMGMSWLISLKNSC
jgi:hypothetical protein